MQKGQLVLGVIFKASRIMAIKLSLLVHQVYYTCVHLCNDFLYRQDSMNYQ